MGPQMTAPTFSPTHHALLFAWIARAVVQSVGEEKGESAVRNATRRYGEQRGRRMALRAEADGHALTMHHYKAYGEWRAAPGLSQSRVIATEPELTVHVLQCPWHRAWEDEDLMPYGRLYCQIVDVALVHGFNPELQLDVNATLTNDQLPCEFVYHGAETQATEDLDIDEQKTVMPWVYHLGHLYTTMRQELCEALGSDGEQAVRSAMECFSERFGEKAAESVIAYRDTDFDRLPE